tara:strand:- start:4544 stop:5068 length:525 start_codon:yes stop_codon:yes gene_type:complete
MMKNLMIVAHPDDESIFGGALLLKSSNWKVICVTYCAEAATSAFERAMKFLKINDYEMWGFECKDRDDAKPWSDHELITISDKLEAELRSTEYEKIVTHGKGGEYGHTQHVELHKIVRKLVCGDLFVFGFGQNRLDLETLFAKIKLLDIYEENGGVWYGWWWIHWITNEEINKC